MRPVSSAVQRSQVVKSMFGGSNRPSSRASPVSLSMTHTARPMESSPEPSAAMLRPQSPLVSSAAQPGDQMAQKASLGKVVSSRGSPPAMSCT